MNPKCDEVGSFFGGNLILSAVFLGKQPKNEPDFGQRPSKLRKEWNFVKSKQIWGQQQNQLEPKNEPDPDMVFKNLIGTAKLNQFYGKFWNFLGQRPPKKGSTKKSS